MTNEIIFRLYKEIKMKLSTLTREQCQQVRKWRNEERGFLRTPYLISEEMQDSFYSNISTNRNSKHRYFSIIEPIEHELGGNIFIGMGGLTNIEWENGTAEISLIINPEYRGKGYGKQAVKMIRYDGINDLRLQSIYGEVYDCGNRGFWEGIVKTYNGYKTALVKRKYWKGKMYGSMWFSI
jgi:RimJ/RimL family protein N-acetyltransferase